MNRTEAVQLAQVVELCTWHGLLVHHCRDSRHCIGAGLPDLIIVGPRGILFRELKTSPTTVTRAQSNWWLVLRAAGVDVGLWLPSDFRDGTVETQIASLAGYPPVA